MKPTRYKKWAVLALALANGCLVEAQMNTVPGPTDYPRFSSFITARNIFDPNRYAHNSTTTRRFVPTRINRSAPSFSLVGTMSYEKGMFAFFDGNNYALRKVLYQSDTNGIAGFTVTEITLTGVTLQTADKKQTLQLKIGETMRQEGSNWQLATGQGGFFAGSSSGESTAPAAADSSSGSETSATPSAALEGNDVLKKLMQQREQELK